MVLNNKTKRMFEVSGSNSINFLFVLINIQYLCPVPRNSNSFVEYNINNRIHISTTSKAPIAQTNICRAENVLWCCKSVLYYRHLFHSITTAAASVPTELRALPDHRPGMHPQC